MLEKTRVRASVFALVSLEALEALRARKEAELLPTFFDQVYFHFRAKQSSHELLAASFDSLARELVRKSSLGITVKSAKSMLKQLALHLPEWCEMKIDVFALVIRGTDKPKLDMTALRAKLLNVPKVV